MQRLKTQEKQTNNNIIVIVFVDPLKSSYGKESPVSELTIKVVSSYQGHAVGRGTYILFQI